ncbi:hypothetical protein FGO68_gene14210 [Halteria grandinella]|uniref:Uncharacterized protein n=1 Tax=Halteria grandinella TaxID=5974 RepID=A0A8J8TA81_HALGN|nr:hypothetical protein FGO68_gene14210 [Halteria grandinella]
MTHHNLDEQLQRRYVWKKDYRQPINHPSHEKDYIITESEKCISSQVIVQRAKSYSKLLILKLLSVLPQPIENQEGNSRQNERKSYRNRAWPTFFGGRGFTIR